MDLDGCGWMWVDLDGCGWMWVDLDGCGWTQNIYAGMSVLACKLNSAGCFLGGVCGSLLNVR